MISIRFQDPYIILKTEGHLASNLYSDFMMFVEHSGGIFNPNKYEWYVQKQHIDTMLSHFHEKHLVWFTSVEEIKGLTEHLVPQFTFSDKHLDTMKLSPFPFQALGISFLAEMKRAIIGDSMGLGKTLQGLGAFHKLYQDGIVTKAIVACPTSLKYQWEEEIQKFTDYKGLVVDGTTKKRMSTYNEFQSSNEYQFLLINYELVRNDIDVLKDFHFDVLICDEAHRLKNRAAKLTKSVKQISADYRFALTGTPLQNRADELFSLFEVINPEVLGSFTEFKKKYLVYGTKFNRRGVLIGYRKLGELRKAIAPFLLRRLKEDVLDDLPRIMYRKIEVDMNETQHKLQDVLKNNAAALSQELADWYETNEAEHPKEGQIMGYLNLMMAVADHPLLFRLSNSNMVKNYHQYIASDCRSPKLDELVEMVEQLLEDPQTKIVIFTQFARMQGLILDSLAPFAECVAINGSMTAKHRQESLSDFREKPFIRVMVCTDAANYGSCLALISRIAGIS
ncbi:DEAD/DEAH box helicase_gp015 [Bacillus phage vB_BceM_WH1]|nr:DEAD/DEAH box helicase_gp015 [Bacillus phage vB_BceM_WH1]